MAELVHWKQFIHFVFMDAIHYKVKEDHQIVTKAAYVVLGVTMDGNKDILGILHRWPERLSESHFSRISKVTDSALHHPSNTLQYPIRRLQGYQAIDGRFKIDLQGRNRRRSLE